MQSTEKVRRNGIREEQTRTCIDLCQINYNSVVRKLIEDIVLYVIEAIREGAGLKMGNCTVNGLLEDNDYFKNALRDLLRSH